MKLYRVIILSFFHGVILTIISILIQGIPWTNSGENTLLQWAIILKRVIFNNDTARYKDQFVFINTSYSNQLISKVDEFGFPLGNQVITDRSQLAYFIGALSRINEHNYIIVDIFFEDESEHDSILREEVEKLKRVVIATSINQQTGNSIPILNKTLGLASVETTDDIFLKYRLFHHDTLKTIPLIVYEQTIDTNWTKGNFFIYHDRLYGFNYFIPDIRISQFNLTESQDYPFLNLSDIMYLNDQTIKELIQGRIVIIGDFLENDNFETLTGNISGPLLLTNIYLALVEGDNLITLKFIIFLIVSFFLISLLVIIPDRNLRLKLRYRNLVIGGSFLIYLGLTSVLSYIIFNKALNVFILSLYLIGANYLLELFYRSRYSNNKY